MLKYFASFLVLLSFNMEGLKAQFTTADVAVNGLTCSQCSRSVEMSLKRLDFVASVEMDLQRPTAHIVFGKDKRIDFSKVAAAVRDAGFAVREIRTRYEFSEPAADGCFIYNKQLYYPVNGGTTAQGNSELLLLGKGMVSDAELKKYQHDEWLASPKCATTLTRTVPFLIIE